MNQIYLYVGLVGVALILYALTRTSSKAETAPVPVTAQQVSAPADQEWKDTLDEFMDELMRDNARLIDSYTEMQIDTKKQLADQQRVIQGLETRLNELQQQIELQAAAPVPEPVTGPLPATEPEPVAEPVQEPERVVPSLFAHNDKYAKVLELSEQGQSMEEIARETNIGIGEIQLVLGIAKRGGR